jgi:hypothetical protein
MFAPMVFWGVSGLLMFWQINAVRWAGAVFIALSLIVAAEVAVMMHQVIAG